MFGVNVYVYTSIRNNCIANTRRDQFSRRTIKNVSPSAGGFQKQINLWKLNKRVQLSCSQQVLHIRMSCCVCPATGTGHLGCAREFRTRGFPNKVNIPVRGVCHVQCLVGLMFVPIIRGGGEKRRDK